VPEKLWQWEKSATFVDLEREKIRGHNEAGRNENCKITIKLTETTD